MYHKLLLINLQFNDDISGLGYIAMNNRVINELWIENNMEESCKIAFLSVHF